jgi:hypothetical protein
VLKSHVKYIIFSAVIAGAICFILGVGLEIIFPRKPADMFGTGVLAFAISPFVLIASLLAVYNIPRLKKAAEKFGED